MCGTGLKNEGNMRLTTQQIQIINQVVSRFAGETAAVYLFGSRLNDQVRGGDVDILIEMDQRPSRIERGRVKMELEQKLGLPVDILIKVRNTEPTPFQVIAHAHAVRLEEPA
jgi:predicted nucleotidyltransferase